MIVKNTSQYLQAILWFILSLIISSANDVLTKYTGSHIDPWQIAFFRCFFGALSLVPLMFYSNGTKTYRTERPWLHILRGSLWFVAIGLWTHGVRLAPIATATIMSFTVPLFVLIMAPICLKERVTRWLWLATLGSFGGILLVLQPGKETLQVHSLFFLLSAILFALLDVVNKRYVTEESLWSMLFYSNLVASILLFLPAWYSPHYPSQSTLGLLFLLGIGGNLLLFFILKAFSLTNASSLAPFRYLELPISITLGYFVFGELPTVQSCLGALMIIVCAWSMTLQK